MQVGSSALLVELFLCYLVKVLVLLAGGFGGAAGGGLMGGQFGFALSLVGTAIGAQFDKLLNQQLSFRGNKKSFKKY